MKTILSIVAVLVLLSAPSVMAQPPGNMCEGNFDLDQDVDAVDVTQFLQDFGRSQYFNPCPAPPMDAPPIMTKYERMFCVATPECSNAGYVNTHSGMPVCCCWDQTSTYNYGCRGVNYCFGELQGICH